MIKFNFQVINPWYKTKFNHIWGTDGLLSKNKAWELQLYFTDYTLFKFELSLDFTGASHAGPRFEICLLGYTFSAMIYDTRHWDYEKNQWEQHE